MSIEIRVSIASKTGFASHQNAVPLLRELTLENTGEEKVENLTVSISADPVFLEPKNWKVDCLNAKSTTHITDREVKLSGKLLADLTESLSGEVKLQVTKGDEVLAECSSPVELLAKNQWGGCGSMSELLPAFCMPNDPAVDRMLKATSDVLRRAGKSDAIDGYESKSRSRSWELVSAIWSAVAGVGLSYALPPASFEEEGQKVRTPGAIMEGRVATCLDTALFFASIMEQARLNPLLIITKGHAFVGAWLQPQEVGQLVIDEAAAIRKRVDLQEMVVFETTLVTGKPVPGFGRAVEAGKAKLTDEDFIMAIDVRRARMRRIRPLALRGGGVHTTDEEQPEPPVSESLEEAPVLPAFDVEVQPEKEGSFDRVTIWQRKLLDLTARNRLLHLPENGKGVELLCPDAGILEDRLAAGQKIKIVPVPDLEVGGRDAALYQQQNRENLYERYAREALDRNEALSPSNKAKLEADLVDLYRKAKSDLDEGGANTLFLALGFLKWKKSAQDPKTYRAPLILLPVKLERKSALSGVKMSLHEDEPRFNLTLLEMLKQDFELNILGLEGTLPRDESGIDVNLIWNKIRQAVLDIPGFEVVTDLVLSTFSFAKYLMWKDLVDRRDQLTKSALVKYLIERKANGDSFASHSNFPNPRDLDDKINPSELFIPLSADSSQIAAVVASAKDCDFVLDGPPGTGKSQTIANMIAHNLAQGRRVLFVAEKRAALEVVYRRLKEKHLSEYCLELHSNKTSKLEVLHQLEAAWDTRDTLSAEEWQREASTVQQLRDRLNEVVRLLHKRHPNGWTLFDAIGRVVRDGNDSVPRFSWPSGTQHDEATLSRLRDVSHRLDLYLNGVFDIPSGFSVINRQEWDNHWQDEIVACASNLPAKIDALISAGDALMKATSMEAAADQEEAIERVIGFVRQLLKAHGVDLSFSFSPDVNEKVASARRAMQVISEYREHEKELSAKYSAEAARRVNLEQIAAEWTKAGQKFWFFSTLAKKQVARMLGEQGGAAGLPKVEADLPRLRQMKVQLDELDRLAPSMNGIPGWANLASDLEKISSALALQEAVHSAVAAVASSPEHLIQIRFAVRTLIVDANGMLAPEGAIAMAVNRLEQALHQYQEVAKRFRELCGIAPEASFDFSTLRQAAQDIQATKVRLKAWCDWCRARKEAVGIGLLPLVLAVEEGTLHQGDIASTFETAYARWFAADIISSEPRLRQFVAAEHASDIEAYRRMTDRLSDLSVRYIRAKVCGEIPSKEGISKDGFAILKRELQKQKRHKPLRQLATEMGSALTCLAPCMLMSPLSIAQYLPAELELFDLVIFDEASQIAPWDAIGSIARGKHVVIAGDPRQMPPTSFFNRAAAAAEDDDEEDMESILDECLAAGIPSHSLSWHYRSRHESLIAFSNVRYYESGLVTFPAAVTKKSAVTWKRVNGVYSKGKGRTNQAEAEEMVKEVVRRLTDPEFAGDSKSLAIVTLNAEQQMLIENLLDRAREQHPEIECFFGEDVAEPVVVKNLETVQGDERDLIMLGITYGPTEPGSMSMSMNFGPLNRDGGWRRLNVAITRAREEMMVFTSFDPSMVDLNRTNARAVRDLKHFLEFADRGPQALAEAVNGSVGGYESPFEEAVARGLINLGWEVVPQIGVSRFRIDLGIVHPDRPGDYLVGVECDGASYHSAATARDRDKVRAGVLRGLGWKLVRVWSTEWWVDKDGALQRLHSQIAEILEQSRASKVQAEQEAKQQEAPAVEEQDFQNRENAFVEAEVNVVDEQLSQLGEVASSMTEYPSIICGIYKIADFAAFADRIDANRFYEPDYDGTLNDLVAHVLSTEAPILDGLLVQRISRAHGFQKAGRIIRERIMKLVEKTYIVRNDPVGGVFIWDGAGSPAKWSSYRTPDPDSAESIRGIDEIASEELWAASRHCAGEDVPVEVSRRFGIRRLSASNRERLEIAITAH